VFEIMTDEVQGPDPSFRIVLFDDSE